MEEIKGKRKEERRKRQKAKSKKRKAKSEKQNVKIEKAIEKMICENMNELTPVDRSFKERRAV